MSFFNIQKEEERTRRKRGESVGARKNIDKVEGGGWLAG
jgi:hypothetical protein